jgi:broad-specificity NMP kinase
MRVADQVVVLTLNRRKIRKRLKKKPLLKRKLQLKRQLPRKSREK